MIQEIKDLIQSINPLYEVEYEENRMMNIKVDEMSRDARFAYIEEADSGTVEKNKYVHQRTEMLRIHFCKLCEMHNTLLEREAIKEEIRKEIVFKFIDKYNDSGIFDRVDIWQSQKDVFLLMFDANVVSVMLQFDCKQNYYV